MTALRGSLGDLVARADGRPIYCTAPGNVRRGLIAAAIDTFGREFPDAEFINALTFYRNGDERRRRWPHDRDHYGAAIVVTRGDTRADGADPFGGLAGEHAISIWVALEIWELVRLRRPVAWHATEFPAAYWLSRFCVDQFDWMRASRWAQLLPAPNANAFEPAIRSSILTGT